MLDLAGAVLLALFQGEFFNDHKIGRAVNETSVGDVLDAFMAVMVLRTCQQVEGGLPASVRSMMLFNIVIDFAVGLVPFVGDLVDALFRANTKNAILLEEHLREKGAKALKAQGRPLPAVDPSDPDEFDRQDAAPSPAYATAQPSRHGNGASTSTRTATQQQHTQSQAAPAEERGGWFGFGKKNKQPDVERGHQDLRREEALPAQSHNQEGSARLQKSSR